MPVDVFPSHGGRRWHLFPRLTPVARFHSPYSRVYTYFPRQAQVRVREVFLRALWQGWILVAPGTSGTFFLLRNDVITRDGFDQENNWAARHRPFPFPAICRTSSKVNVSLRTLPVYFPFYISTACSYELKHFYTAYRTEWVTFVQLCILKWHFRWR